MKEHLTLLEQVRFNLRWDRRHEHTLPTPEVEAIVDAQINAMTPLELLTLISEALEE